MFDHATSQTRVARWPVSRSNCAQPLWHELIRSAGQFQLPAMYAPVCWSTKPWLLLGPSHDVPVSIVAKDPEVLEKIADWGWTDGLQPADSTPTWRMDKFRDRFMTAFGPQQPGGTS